MIPGGLLIRLGAAALVITILVLAVTAIRSRWVQEGRDEVIESINRQNQEAGNAADDARARFDAGCPGGLRFDFATGKCAGTASGRGN